MGFIYFVTRPYNRARFGSTYTKIGTIQRRLAWPLRKDDMQIREVFHIKKKKDLEMALAGVAQLFELRPANQRVPSTCLSCGPGPQ